MTHVLVLSRWCYVLGPEDDEARIFAAEGVLVRLLVMAPQAPSLQDIAAAIVEPGRSVIMMIILMLMIMT